MNKYAVNIVILLSIVCLISLRHFRFDFNTSGFFPSRNADVKFYQQFQQKFQTQADYELTFIALENRDGIFEQAFLKKAEELTQYISGLEHIRKVYSITNTNILFFKNSQIGARPLIHIQNPEWYPDDSVYLFKSPEYKDLLISKNGKSIAIAVFNEEGLTLSQKSLFTESIQKKLRSLDFDKFHLTSITAIETSIRKEINKELKIFGFFSLIFFPVAGFLFFGSLRFGLAGLLAVVISTLWTFTIMILAQYKPDLFSIYIPFVLLTATVSGFIHFFPSSVFIHDESILKTSKKARIQKTLFPTIVFIALAFSLLFINNGSVRNFGIFCGLALLINYVLSLIFIPSGFVKPFFIKEGIRSDKILADFFKTVVRYKKLILIFFILLFAVCLYFIPAIQFNVKLTDQLPINSSVTQDYKFMEKNFSGLIPFEMQLSVRNSHQSFFDVGLMKKVEDIEKFLGDSCGIGGLISPLSLFKGANKAFNGGQIEFYKLPESRTVPRLYDAIMQTEHADEMQRYTVSDGSSIRISGKTPELTLTEFNSMVKGFDKFFRRRGYAESFSYQITGPAFLLNKSLSRLPGGLMFETFVGFLILSLLIFYHTRKINSVLIALISAGLPLVFMAGAIGFLKINLGMESLILFLIALGLTSANSITIFFCQEKDPNDHSGRLALKNEFIKSARTLIGFNFLLLLLFVVLLNSNFQIVVQLGLSLFVCVFFSLLINLCFIPFLKETSK